MCWPTGLVNTFRRKGVAISGGEALGVEVEKPGSRFQSRTPWAARRHRLSAQMLQSQASHQHCILWVGPRSGERRHLVSSVPVTGPPMPLAARPLGRKVGWLQFKRWALMQGSPWDFWKSPKSLNGRDLHCEPPSSSQILPDPTPAAPDSPEQGLEEWKPTGTRKGQ